MADVRDNFLRRICTAVAAVLAVALVAVMMSAAPASATTIGNDGRADFTAQALSSVLLADGDCAPEKFCAWSGPSYTGEKVSWYECDTYEVPDSFTGTGSWKNNQTSGTQAKFYDYWWDVQYTTPGAYSENAAYDWWPVWDIKPC